MNKEKKNRNLLINRVLLFSFSIIATPMSFIVQGIPIGIFTWLMYFTTLSNIFVFIWSSIVFLNIYLENFKIKSFSEHWFIKNITTLCIFITGVVFTIILFPWSIAENPSNWLAIVMFYFGLSLAQHVLVPIFMVTDFFLTKGSDINNQSNKDLIIKTSISTIIPLFWLSLSLILIYFNVLSPQYPFMDVFDTQGNSLIINVFILLLIAISWMISFFLLLKYSNENNSKYNILKKQNEGDEKC